MILETERLFLREMRQNDFRDLAEILQNPNVMYAYEHDFSEDDVQVWLDRQIDRYKKYGFGLWAVILKNTNEMIGQAGLTIQPYKNAEVLEIGYLLKERFWHCGYATEAAMACKNYGFGILRFDALYSIIRDNNTASRNVALRNGMQPVDTVVKHYRGVDMPHIVFRADATEWL